ncbi:MAG TPA: hypothetical protein VMO26_17155 [Vicinamibacterales bacterium]|nr:hypothetical protein [Vicinamibacterales bacterium]
MNTSVRTRVPASVAMWQAFWHSMMIAAFVVWAPADSQAQEPDGMEVRAYGAVGLARGETVRLIVVNLLSPILHPPNPCRVHLAFVDAAGMVWPGENRQPASRTADLLPGESVALVLSSESAFARESGVRAAVRAVMANPGPPDAPTNPCVGLAPTLEIFDVITGWTQVAYSNPGPLEDTIADEFFASARQARLGYIGLARGLVARLNASRIGLPSRSELPPNPCLVTLAFRNREGELWTTRSGEPAQIQGELLVGQTISLALSSADVIRGNSVAEIVNPVLTTPGPPNAPPNPCADVIGTVEIFDGLTGRIHGVWTAPGPPDIPVPETR